MNYPDNLCAGVRIFDDFGPNGIIAIVWGYHFDRKIRSKRPERLDRVAFVRSSGRDEAARQKPGSQLSYE